MILEQLIILEDLLIFKQYIQEFLILLSFSKTTPFGKACCQNMVEKEKNNRMLIGVLEQVLNIEMVKVEFMYHTLKF